MNPIGKNKERENQNIKLVIFSDLHYNHLKTSISSNGRERKLTGCAEPLIDELIKEVARIKPNIVVSLGDLVQDIYDNETDLKNFVYILSKLKHLDAPFYTILGDHEIRAFGRDRAAKILGYKNPTYSLDMNGCHLVFISQSVNIKDNDGKRKEIFLSEEDLQWLKKDLKQNELPVIIFSHAGLAEDDMKGNFFYEDGKLPAHYKNKVEIKSILKETDKIIGVFSGHQHWTKTIVEHGIPYCVCGSMVENKNGSGIPDGVWFEADFCDGKLNVKEHHITLKPR